MLLDLPVPEETAGPEWSYKLTTALERVAEHDHTSNNGVRIPASAININSALDYNQQNATNIKLITLGSNVSTYGAGTIRGVYDYAGDLYYNNGSGASVKITNGSAVNIGNIATSIATIVNVASNQVINPSDGYTIYDVNTSGGAYTITLSSAAAVSSGRYYIIRDSSGNASTNNITISRAGSDSIESTTSYSIKINGGAVIVVQTSTSTWKVIPLGSRDWMNGLFTGASTNWSFNGSICSLTASGDVSLNGSTITFNRSNTRVFQLNSLGLTFNNNQKINFIQNNGTTVAPTLFLDSANDLHLSGVAGRNMYLDQSTGAVTNLSWNGTNRYVFSNNELSMVNTTLNIGSNPATTGKINLSNTNGIFWKNGTNVDKNVLELSGSTITLNKSNETSVEINAGTSTAFNVNGSQRLRVDNGYIQLLGTIRQNWRTITGDTTLSETGDGYLICNTTSANITLTLPASPTIGTTFTITKRNPASNVLTVNGSGGIQIMFPNSGATSSVSMAGPSPTFSSIQLTYNGAYWNVDFTNKEV